ncbi:hypothetical protein RIF29_08523 [Crotalaria pallida]|uniref:RRM domain-containing protein n=1 Tax=Crotalaria pallida TaxID=3830 RepID=A0AAN9FTQ9_CROPI
MGETGFNFIIRLPGNLDPTAQEFRPTTNIITHPLPPPPPPFLQPATVFTHHPSSFNFPVAVGLPYGAPHLSYSPPPPPNLSTSPTRSLLISPLPNDLLFAISESLLRRELEVFGDVRGVQMENLLTNGAVTVHFYDLRHAETALTAIQGQHMMHQARLRNYYMFKAAGTSSPFPSPPPLPPPERGVVAGRAVWAQFVVPACNAVPEGQNQGTIVVFNLDSDVSAKNVRELFEAFGPVKELRHAPTKKNQRFVEFFDTRDAAKALKDMNGKEIYGKVVVIEYSRAGGHNRKFFHSNNNKPFNLNNNVPPPLSLSPSLPLLPPQPPPLPPQSQRKFSDRFVTNASPRSHLPQPQLPFKKSSSFNKRSPRKIANSTGSIEEVVGEMKLSEEAGNSNNVVKVKYSQGSSRRNSIIRDSSFESMVESTKQHQQQEQQVHRNGRYWKGKHGKKHETWFLIKEDGIVESGSRDTRTTVMIKNIPNKYSQKLLLNMLDNHCIHCNEQIGDGDDQPLSSYDFVYLPIDFNNKCNVGYGFVNMTSPEATLRLYKAFHRQHWEVFNSRKICEVTYARVQGLEALKEHFKNSKFPCEMDHYMPVVFSPPRDGKKELTEPLPIVGTSNQHQHQTIPIPISIGVSNSDEIIIEEESTTAEEDNTSRSNDDNNTREV